MGTTLEAALSGDPRQWLLANRDSIAALARRTGQRQGLAPADQEDLVSEVMVKLIENDYAVLRAFTGRSRCLTFVVAVIHNLAQDQRYRTWGKPRISAAARRLGPAAIAFELWTSQKGHTQIEAAALLRERFPDLEETEIRQLAEQIPRRSSRKFTDLRALDESPSPDRADERIEGQERLQRLQRVRQELRNALATLDPSWRGIVEWRLQRGRPIDEIAQHFGRPKGEIYRIVERAKIRLRARLERAGIRATAALADLGWDPARPPLDSSSVQSGLV